MRYPHVPFDPALTRRQWLQSSSACCLAAGLPGVSLETLTSVRRERLVSSSGSERATSGAGGKIATFDGRTHVVWQDATDDGAYLNRARSLDHATGRWSETVTLNQGRDNHARPVITADSAGFLHVVLSGHGSPVTYRCSREPNSTSAWTDPQQIGSGTYPTLVCARDGTLHVALRNPVRWNGVDLYRKPPGGAWLGPTHLIVRDPELPGYGAFHNGLAWGPGQRTLHLVQDFYESREAMSGRGVHQAVAYLRSRDGGTTWETAGGAEAALPARPEQMDVLARSRAERHEPMPPPEVLAQGSIVVDRRDRPHILYISHLDAPGQPLHATLDDSGHWRQHRIEVLAEAYPYHRPLGCRGSWTIDSGGVLYGLLELVPYPAGWRRGKPWRAMRFDPAGKRLVWIISRDGGETFETRPALDDGVVFHQANVERPTGRNTVRSGRLPPFVYFDGESRYRTEDEVLQNRVFFQPG